MVFLRDSHTVSVELTSSAHDIFIYRPLAHVVPSQSRARTCLLPVVLAGCLVERGTLLADGEAFDLELLTGLAEIYNDTSYINKF